MKTLCIWTIFLSLALLGCISVFAKIAPSYEVIHSLDISKNPRITSSNIFKATDEVTLTKCKTLYDDNLVAIHWVTVTNNTNKVIKGIKIRATVGDEPFMYKMIIGAHTSKRLNTNRFNCRSNIVGIVFSNGEYEGINEDDIINPYKDLGIDPSKSLSYPKN